MGSTIRISILADANNAVRGFRNTGAAADGTNARLRALQRRVDALDGRNVDIEMKTDGFARGVGQIVVANLALDRLRAGLPDLSFGLTGIANKLSLVAAAALAATSAVGPLVAAGTAVGAAFGAATVGVGLFGAAAIPTFKAVTGAVTEYNTASHAYDRAKSIGDTAAMTSAQKAMASSLNALTPLQRAAALQTLAMNDAWEKLSATQAPTVLKIITDATATLGRIIPRLVPAIDAMAGAVKQVSSTAFDGLAKSVAPAVALVQGQGVPAFKSMSTVIGNLLVTVGHVVTAFAPLGNIILARLAPLTAGLRLINFDSLAKSAGALLPAVGTLLSNLAGVFGNLVKAAAPLAGPVLAALGAIAIALRTALGGPEIGIFVANIAKVLPAVAPIVTVLITTFLKFAAVISSQLLPLIPALLPVVSQMAGVFLNVLTGLSPLLPVLLDLIGVLVSLLPVLFPIITAFRDVMVPVVKALSGALVLLRPTFSLVINAVIALLKPVAGLVGALVKVAPVLVGALIPAFVAVVAIIGRVLAAVTPLLPLFSELVPPITAVIVSLVQIAPVLVGALVPALVAVVAAAGRLLTAFSPLLPVVGQVVTAVLTGLTPVLASLGDALPEIVGALTTMVDPLAQIAVAALPIIPPISRLALTLLDTLVPAALALVPVLVTVADVLGAAIPVAIAILNPVLSATTALLGSPTFVAFAGIVAGIYGAVKLWSLAQAGLTTVTTIAAGVQRAFQAVLNIGQLLGFAGSMVRVQIATAAQAVSARAAAISQQALNAAQNIGQLIRYAAQVVASNVATAASAVASRTAAVAQGVYNLAINSTAITAVRTTAALVASKVALVATAVATKAATAAQWLLNVALDANPIGLIVLAIAALVIGLIYAYKHSETFRKIVDGALRGVAKAFAFLWDGAKRVFGWLKDNWKLVVAIIAGPIGLVIRYVTTHWGQIRDTIVNGFNSIVGFFTGIPGRFLAAGRAIMQGLLNGINSGLQFVRDKVRGLAGLIPTWLKEVLGIHSPSSVGTDIGANFGNSIGGGVASAIPKLKRTLAGVGSVITDGLSVDTTVGIPALSSGVTKAINVGVSAARPVAVAVAAPSSAAAAAALPGITINVTVSPGADPAETGRQVVNAIEAYERRTGTRRLLTGARA